MKLEHLSFAQLYKLRSPETLVRIAAAYHKALRRRWNVRHQSHGWELRDFSVTLAETVFPPTVHRPWRRVLAFLRSSELKSALRKSADVATINQTRSWLPLRKLTARAFPNRFARHALADIIVYFCIGANVDAATFCGVEDYGDIEIRVKTDAEGMAILESKTGLPWEDVVQYCADTQVDPDRVFWWLQWADDKTGWRVNPCNWPVNTPDYQETAKELIEK